jgi:hypothetical protein
MVFKDLRTPTCATHVDDAQILGTIRYLGIAFRILVLQCDSGVPHAGTFPR